MSKQLFCVATLGNLVVDLSAPPHVPTGWTLDMHLTGAGSLDLSASNIGLYVTRGQRRGGSPGTTVWRSIVYNNQITLNANVLDALLKHENQHLVPESWRNMEIVFWGTLYRNDGGYRCVRSMSYSPRVGWQPEHRELDLGLSDCYPAAVLVK